MIKILTSDFNVKAWTGDENKGLYFEKMEQESSVQFVKGTEEIVFNSPEAMIDYINSVRKKSGLKSWKIDRVLNENED